ncbi:MAG: hypothetical protein AB7Q37_05125 [Pyrinomonadaceae bacterium]
MFLSNPAISRVLFAAMLASFTGCGWLNPAVNSPPQSAEETAGKLPFKTREPENFQCDIVETGAGVTRRKRLAMRGSWSRLDLDLGTPGHRAVLVTDKEYLIDFGRRTYAEVPNATSGEAGRFSDLTRELLLANPRTNFEEIGREGTIIRYRAASDNSEQSEVIIHYDTALELPAKQEFFTVRNGERTLSFTIEIANFSLEPDPGLFELPAGFRRVAIEEVAAGPKI